MRRRYLKTEGRGDKERLISEVVANTGYHRKSVIRLLNAPAARRGRRRRRARARRYEGEVIAALLMVWRAADYACALLLHAALPGLLSGLQRHGHLRMSGATEQLLRQMSRSTMERMLTVHRHLRPAGRYTPRRPDGGDPRGTFVRTINCIDRATYWSAKQATYGCRHDRMLAALRNARARMPMAWRRLHFDGGPEYVNRRVVGLCRADGIQPFISRPYRSNDNARVENRNRYQIRRRVGRGRIDDPARLALLNQL
jgi:transposase InsO family protein